MRHVVFALIPTVVVLVVGLVLTEMILSALGFGNPPLYQSDPEVGYVLKPSQNLTRLRGARVFINSLGMRSNEVAANKPAGVYRVLLLGDSVPFGGSYIDQDDLFCSVALRRLHLSGNRYQLLNAGINDYGPRNIWKYLQKHGDYDADMIISYLPWGNLTRHFTNFLQTPFWSNNPDMALAEFFRHGMWRLFGMFSKRWKSAVPNARSESFHLNMQALQNIRVYCQARGIPVYFIWSPYRCVLTGEWEDDHAAEKKEYGRVIGNSLTVDMSPVLEKYSDIDSLYKDDCHYSAEGHRIVGEHLAAFIAARRQDVSTTH